MQQINPVTGTGTAVLVVLGEFDPLDFSPLTLVKAGALTEAELFAIEDLHLLPKQLTKFQIDRLKVEVLGNRIGVESTRAPYVLILDLVAKVLREVSAKPKITSFGINWSAHYDLGDIGARDAVGMRLCPPTNWGEWGKAIDAEVRTSSGPKHGGLIAVRMQQRQLDDRPSGHIEMRIEPSALVGNSRGIFCHVNDHYEIDRSAIAGSVASVGDVTEDLLRLAVDRFDDSIKRSQSIIADVVGRNA